MRAFELSRDGDAVPMRAVFDLPSWRALVAITGLHPVVEEGIPLALDADGGLVVIEASSTVNGITLARGLVRLSTLAETDPDAPAFRLLLAGYAFEEDLEESVRYLAERGVPIATVQLAGFEASDGQRFIAEMSGDSDDVHESPEPDAALAPLARPRRLLDA